MPWTTTQGPAAGDHENREHPMSWIGVLKTVASTLVLDWMLARCATLIIEHWVGA